MITTAPSVFGQLAALAEPARSRILLLLEQQPLSVGEVCSVVQLPQSTVSRHLRALADEGWVSARAEGAARLYRLGQLAAPARRIWETLREELIDTPGSHQDQQRLKDVLRSRRNRSAEFFAESAAQWESLRAELFGTRTETLPLLSLLDPEWTVGDLGCGTGQVGRTLAPFVGRVICVDGSPAMLSAARQRTLGIENLELRAGRLEDLPIADGELDVALLMLVLHYLEEPALAVAEARRALRPGGRVVVVDMAPHQRAEYVETMGHVWPGFSRGQMTEWLTAAGFEAPRFIDLPADPQARGPLLFSAVATASASNT